MVWHRKSEEVSSKEVAAAGSSSGGPKAGAPPPGIPPVVNRDRLPSARLAPSSSASAAGTADPVQMFDPSDLEDFHGRRLAGVAAAGLARWWAEQRRRRRSTREAAGVGRFPLGSCNEFTLGTHLSGDWGGAAGSAGGGGKKRK